MNANNMAKGSGYNTSLSMLINYFNLFLNLIKPTVNNIYNEGKTHAGRVPSVDGVTPYHSSVDTTSNGSKKPDHGQMRGNEFGVRRV